MPKKEKIKGQARKVRVFQQDSAFHGDHVVIEVPPCQRSIFALGGQIYYLSFPYIVFDIDYYYDYDRKKYIFNRARIGFRNKPIPKNKTSIETGHTSLTNVAADAVICFGTKKIPMAKDIGGLVMNVLKAFWTTGFNTGLDFRTPILDDRVKTFATWAANSANDPDFITHVKWPVGRVFEL